MAEDKQKKNLTVFGQETEFDGVLEFTDNLVITGKFKGEIRATGDLEVEKGAVCDVKKMTANSIVISGTVTGDIDASERVEMCSGSLVRGDVKTARIRIAEDVEFEGEVSMLEKEPDVSLFSVASKEYKDALVIKSDDPR
ncbi:MULTISPECIES: polymer-forming cytoskeletal protein [unclassified Treponema]|uniref:bactofilin family protein n=1 Tax=unclassified Treponema TaxID=2638727 RepID=UPI001B22156E|nr:MULTISPECIES: polymer-forming cytoskeletal protein [unclassified Treponema]MBO6218885.1 polymer-forming cytoskeletal protein [Treponema sp.]MBQ8680564.1 polymer-forming cytoskeletal protein [Treponema sp.]